jgi:hypothetical protein
VHVKRGWFIEEIGILDACTISSRVNLDSTRRSCCYQIMNEAKDTMMPRGGFINSVPLVHLRTTKLDLVSRSINSFRRWIRFWNNFLSFFQMARNTAMKYRLGKFTRIHETNGLDEIRCMGGGDVGCWMLDGVRGDGNCWIQRLIDRIL